MTRFALARAASAAALALAAFAATPTGASAAVTTQHFQKTVSVACTGLCSTKFPKLPANQALDIDHVACELNTAGEVVQALLLTIPKSPNFGMPFGVIWQRDGLGMHLYTLGGEMNVRVALGGQAEIALFATDGSAYGSCSITGTLIIKT